MEEKKEGHIEKIAHRKEVIEELIAMHERHRDRFSKRDSELWKLSLAFWSALGVSAVLLSKGEITLDRLPLIAAFAVVVLVAAGFHTLVFVRQCSKANMVDQEIAKPFLDAANRIVQESEILNSVEKSDLEEAISTGNALFKKMHCKDQHWWTRHAGTKIQYVLSVLMTVLVMLACLSSYLRGSGKGGTGQEVKVEYKNTTTQPTKNITFSNPNP